MMRIPITKPVFGPEEMAAVQAPLESGWVVQGPRVAEFERKFGAFAGAPAAVAASSCTTALHLALCALGVKPGDEVIVPAFTWISTANVVEYLGATPVFCDVDLATYNMDVDHAASLVTAATVGIVPVHLFGLCAAMDDVLALARRRGLWVVEDAACGFGARIRGQHAGTFGDAGCFSFHPRKAITTGEGGMLTTARDDVAALARSLRDHGACRSDFDRHQSSNAFLLAGYPRLGFNYRMTDLQGALGCAQMDRAEWILANRRRVASRYDTDLAALDWLERPRVPAGFDHGYQAYVCLFRPETPAIDNVPALHARRTALMASLEQAGIATRPGTHAAALTEYYARKYSLTPAQFPRAWTAEQLTLTLPLYPQQTDDEIGAVCSALQSAIALAH